MPAISHSPVARATAAGWALALLPLALWPGLGPNLLSTVGLEGHAPGLAWTPSLIWLHGSMDLLIGFAYVSISSTLAYLVYRARRDIPFHWVLLAFGLFIVACGFTHFMHVLTLWTPVYWLEGYVKVVTAVASVLTAVVLPPLVAPAVRVARDARLLVDRERELAAANAQLAARNAELDAVNRELAALTAEQETFAYTVSHDLRSPLLAMQGMTGVVRESLASGDADGAAFALSRVEANVGRMGALLGDVLALSRVGRAAADPESLDLGEAVASALRDLQPRVDARGVRVELPAAWPTVVVPRSELDQLLANLLGNAVKWAGREPGADADAPPVRPPRVRASWEREGERVILRVDDNGSGVPPQHRERVFGLFQKLDAKAEGTGVGLAIVKRIAERHGGRVWVEDSDLGGASFAVSLRGVAS